MKVLLMLLMMAFTLTSYADYFDCVRKKGQTSKSEAKRVIINRGNDSLEFILTVLYSNEEVKEFLKYGLGGSPERHWEDSLGFDRYCAKTDGTYYCFDQSEFTFFNLTNVFELEDKAKLSFRKNKFLMSFFSASEKTKKYRRGYGAFEALVWRSVKKVKIAQDTKVNFSCKKIKE